MAKTKRTHLPSLLLLALPLFGACASSSSIEANYDQFGAGVANGPAVALVDVLKTPESFTGKPIRLTGDITGVCQTKGCWMTLGDQKPPVVVRFKDYGFFVPKDAGGRTAIVEGELTVKQESVEETRHYLEDAGKHDEAMKITEGRKTFQFMATGVAITKPKG